MGQLLRVRVEFMDISEQQLLAEVEDILRTMPARETLGNDNDEVMAWIGRASALIHAWSSSRAIFFDSHVRGLGSPMSVVFYEGARGVLTMLNEARHDLRLKTVGPLTIAVDQGRVFDYFDEVRKVIESVKIELLFVDPYLDAEFTSRYLPHVSSSVVVRLLARENLGTLLPAVVLLRQQRKMAIEVRSAKGFHDRYIFVDRLSCYQSGASFKDGAKKAPTTLTQITDAFSAVLDTYEQRWSGGIVQG